MKLRLCKQTDKLIIEDFVFIGLITPPTSMTLTFLIDEIVPNLISREITWKRSQPQLYRAFFSVLFQICFAKENILFTRRLPLRHWGGAWMEKGSSCTTEE